MIDLDTQGNATDTLEEFSSGLTTSNLFLPLTAAQQALTAIPNGEPVITLIAADPGLADLEDLDLGDAGENFRDALSVLAEQGYDLCLIDTPPSLGKALTIALYVADFFISPIQLKRYSLSGINKMNTAVGAIRQFNPDLQFLGMVPSMLERRKQRQLDNLAQLNEDFPGYVLPEIGLRDSIDEALELGRPVWEIKKTAARVAAKEMRAFTQCVFEKMGVV
ncbi:Chromosome (plasmid) partitioning protein ParA [Metapseudomonas furukawaii]|uniref:Chromosome (Plasmid) partitioning protein n=1 Tax=Metapseudomonas furukawaii TaxID=1149133 RepID=A0AAD1C4M6_METFU|nr:Chromosome (plasmid) partitioning protein ParA [Pseudomonas furukawaii]BAU77431.1 chromosome (plasmid) partitioning protein [Pseudomonas furukawaii]